MILNHVFGNRFVRMQAIKRDLISNLTKDNNNVPNNRQNSCATIRTILLFQADLSYTCLSKQQV